jgi:hypothetical protein
MAAENRSKAEIQKSFTAAGFELGEADGKSESFEVRKNNCAQAVARNSSGDWAPAPPPYFVVRALKCELEDHGYQKFWFANGKRFPIRLSDLRAFQRFIEEVRYVLGFKSLYNESLGSTCARSVYDRLDGRPDQ